MFISLPFWSLHFKSVHLERKKKVWNNSRRWQGKVCSVVFRQIWIFRILAKAPTVFLAILLSPRAFRNRCTALWRGKSFKNRTWVGAKYQNYVKARWCFTLLFPTNFKFNSNKKLSSHKNAVFIHLGWKHWVWMWFIWFECEQTEGL